MSMLPSGWVNSSIFQVTSYVQRGKSPKYAQISPLPVVNQKCVRWFGLEEQHLKFVDPSQWSAWTPERYLQPGDILWNSTGTGTIGRAAIFEGFDRYSKVVADSHVTVVRPLRLIEPKYLHALIRSPIVQSKIDDMQSGSTNQVELSREQVLSTVVPLPPLEEQRRIIRKIDGISAKSKRASDHLRQANALISKYKLSLLDSVLNKSMSNVAFCSVAEVCISIADGDHQPPPISDNGIPFITISTINDGTLRLEKVTRKVPSSYIEKLKPQRIPSQGDILFAVTGATIGRSAIVECESEFVFQRHIALLKPDRSKIIPKLLLYILRARNLLDQMYSAATGTAQPTVPISAVRRFQIRVPPFEKQANILEHIEAAHRCIDRLGAEIADAHKFIDRLDQAVLSKAFRGELVPQDPNDEPASVLLERIRAESTGPSQTRKGRGRPRTVSA